MTNARRRCGSAVWAVLVVLCAAVALLAVTGWRLVPVLSGSMRPTLQPGDLVAARPQPAGLLLVGQTVIYAAPVDGRPVVVHRVIDVRREGDDVIFRTRGDANDAPDSWTASIPTTGKILVSRGALPRAGRAGHAVAALTTNSTVPLTAVTLLTLLLLLQVWRPERRRSAGIPDQRRAAEPSAEKAGHDARG